MTNYGLNNTVISTGQRATFGSVYTLDGVGNRTSVDLTEPLVPSFPPEEAGYAYDTGNILTAADGMAYTHDANGNRSQKATSVGTTYYTYDPLNRLTQVADGTQTTQYLYNGLGQRVARIENGVRTNYLIDPHGILPQVVAETDNTGNLIAYYVYDGAGLVAKITSANEYYFYHYDGLGSTVAITDSTGDVVNTYAYSPYGLVGGQETVTNSFKYIGRFGVMDEGNGLYYMRARYYDPEVGRFINKDPIGYLGGMNLFTYCANNPISLIDPWGLKKWDYYSLSFTFSPTLGFLKYLGFEFGISYLADPCTGEYYQWFYVSGGVGFGGGGAVQIEKGAYYGPEDPTQISASSLTISGFGANWGGYGGQVTGTSFWGEGEWGYTHGLAFGKGGGIAGMYTHFFYLGKGAIKTDGRNGPPRRP